MPRRNALFMIAIFTATFFNSSSLVAAAQGIIFKNADSSGQYCHLKFPAITRDSLYTDRPVLKDPSEGDIIDFYGPCDHDPRARLKSIARKQTVDANLLARPTKYELPRRRSRSN